MTTNYNEKITIKSCAIIIIYIGLLTCCGSNKQSDYSETTQYYQERISVVTTPVKFGLFYKEIISNGILKARNSAKIRFKQDGDIVLLSIKNGKHVDKGDILAKVDDKLLLLNYKKAIQSVEKSLIEVENLLLNRGYSLKDSATVPHNILKNILIKSGYNDANIEKQIAKERLNETVLIAPFSGVIADLSAKKNNSSDQYDNLCTLIDNSSFEVSFSLMETEINSISIGDLITGVPLFSTHDSIVGKVVEINPRVSDNGMITVRAQIDNSSNLLTDGMNLTVIIKQSIGEQLYIPKETITLRHQRSVIFLNRGDTAIWRYVNVLESNSKYSVITGEDILQNDKVVIEGHLNLSHYSLLNEIQSLE